MPYPSTPALRPVSQTVHNAIGDLPSGFFNFGLYFQKWLYVVNGANCPRDRLKRPKPWACSMSDETDVVKNQDFCNPNVLLDNFEVSLALFNGLRQYHRDIPKEIKNRMKSVKGEKPLAAAWDRDKVAALLGERHRLLEEAARAYQLLGYEYHCLEAVLISPLVMGLGNEHPTEKGFRFHWTLGIPFIPASSIKGVVRLAFLVNRLNQAADEAEALRLWQEFTHDQIPANAVQLFGTGGDTSGRRGGVIFLDAFPATLPKLKAEIMNCHYPKYYQGERGPTLDQQPNPQRFWALDTMDSQKRPLRFTFRVLLHPEGRTEDRRRELLAAIQAAWQDHGLGAKTAIGHGRLQPVGPEPGPAAPAGVTPTPQPKWPAPQTADRPRPVQQEAPTATGNIPAPAAPTAPVTQVWEGASLTWNPGSQEMTATWKGKKALSREKNLVPQGMRTKLFDKKKAVQATVTVSSLGNKHEIIAID